MLEERLSNTYKQHPYAAYNSHQSMQRPQSSMYPSINPGGPDIHATGAESFYTGQPAPTDPYGRPPPSAYPTPGLSQPSYPSQYPPYSTNRRRSSATSSTRAPSLKYRQGSSDHVPTIRQAPNQYPADMQQPQQPQYQASQSSTAPPYPTDPAAAYYYGDDHAVQSQYQQQPLSQDQASDFNYPQSQPPQYSPGQQQTTQAPQQYPPQPQHLLGSQGTPYPTHQQQPPYYQNSTMDQSQSNAHPLQSNFPAAPTYQPAPQEPVVEESLIEL